MRKDAKFDDGLSKMSVEEPPFHLACAVELESIYTWGEDQSFCLVGLTKNSLVTTESPKNRLSNEERPK